MIDRSLRRQKRCRNSERQISNIFEIYTYVYTYRIKAGNMEYLFLNYNSDINVYYDSKFM